MLHSRFSFACALVCSALSACSDDSATTSTSSSSSSGPGGAGGDGGTSTVSAGGNGGQGGQGGQGGSGGSQVVCTPDDGTILAVSELFMGDTGWDGIEAADAWQNFGRNVDGVITTDDFSQHCTPSSGAAPVNVFPDGPNGLDNAFGKTIIPIIKAATSGGISQPATMAIQMGGSTLIFDLLGVTGADQSPVETRLYGSADLGTAPAFDGSDCWPVAESTLSDPADITSANTIFPDASLAADVWSSGAPQTIDVTFGAAGIAIPLRIYQAQIVMRLDPTHTSATQSELSGVIDTEELIATISDAAGAFDPLLCNGAILQQVANQIRQASDLMADGTQGPGATCNGISVGLGFSASAVHLGGIGPGFVPPDTCP